jgi:hypothetical protein
MHNKTKKIHSYSRYLILVWRNVYPLQVVMRAEKKGETQRKEGGEEL